MTEETKKTFNLERFRPKGGPIEPVLVDGNGTYVIRDGQRIDIGIKNPAGPVRKGQRQPFEVQFVQVPIYWVRQLERHNSAALYHLAHYILEQDHKRRYFCGGEIILSTEATGLPRQTRGWAIKIMVEAKMISVSQSGNQAVRVVELLNTPPPRP
jgi:hypothetical protein